MNNKRETLKKVAGVSAVVALAPTAWTKPVLNSIILPVHAQTSGPTIELVSNGSFDAFGTAVTFQDAELILSNNSLRLLITFNAEIDPSQVAADENINEVLNIQAATLESEQTGSSLRIPPNFACNPDEDPVTYIPPGVNTFDIEFSDLGGTQFTTLTLLFHSRRCGLRDLGTMTFRLNIPA